MLMAIYSTGYGQHGDYIFGWKDGVLQKALDARCSGNACSSLKTQSAAQATQCSKSQIVHEPFDGCKFFFPSCVGFDDTVTDFAQG